MQHEGLTIEFAVVITLVGVLLARKKPWKFGCMFLFFVLFMLKDEISERLWWLALHILILLCW